MNRLENIASKYSTNRIIILGKGQSSDGIANLVFESAVVIALNDAERIYPADVTIFREEWAGRSIRENGYRSELYLSSSDFQAGEKSVYKLEYRGQEGESSDLTMSRLMNEKSLEIEHVMLLTALKVARLIALHRGIRQEVLLVGFDFDADSGYSRSLDLQYDPEIDETRRANLEAQKYYLSNARYFFRDSELEIHHVGDKPFSTVSARELNVGLSSQDASQSSAANRSNQVLVTAEITTNHFGDRSRLEKLIREAKSAGADYVKFQARDVDSFYTREQLDAPYVSPFGGTFRQYRHALELSDSDFEFIGNLCDELDIGWFLSVLDLASYERVRGLGREILKLPSTISEHLDYLSFVASDFKGEVVISTGMTDEKYESWILDKFKDSPRLYLLHANSAYPTPQQDCNIAVVRRYSQLSNEYPHLVPGWSSHDPGWFGSALAVAAGAKMIEKHVKLGNTEWAHFDSVALDLETGEFTEFVEKIRLAETITGDSQKRVTPSEHHKYKRR